MAVIEAKVAGEAPAPAQKVEPTRIGDLMAALEASVAGAREARRVGASAKGKAAPAAKAAAKAATVKAGTKAGAKAAKSAKPAKATRADEAARPRQRKSA
jgi:hypothetical protein